MKKVNFKRLTDKVFIYSLLLSVFLISSCKKVVDDKNNMVDDENNTINPVVNTISSAIPKGYVMTPSGILMKAENVHLIKQGYRLLIKGGHAYRVETKTSAIVEDIGNISSDTSLSVNSTNNNLTAPSGSVDGDNWVTYSQAQFTSPITYFATNWTVPANPTNNPGDVNHLFYLWNGISPSPTSAPLIQPVLQWGSNNVWGGAYWTIANWCILSNSSAAYSSPITVPVGTNLQGVINRTGVASDGSNNYTCGFTNYPNITLNIVEGNTSNGGQYPYIPNIMDAYEVLEDPNQITSTTQYPNQSVLQMNNISLTTESNTPSTINWTPISSSGATLGECTQIINNSALGQGEVGIHFYSTTSSTPDPSIDGKSSIVLGRDVSPAGSWIIKAQDGHLVNVSVTCVGSDSYNFNISGATFTDGTTYIQGTSTLAKSFYMTQGATVQIYGSAQLSSNSVVVIGVTY
ncbi:hypothetical protein A9P82_07955 [Arachidicoccus ginsenosidimutans]|uniref:hypothetical protein n=1 Tax=Arachidicoccus sp. BS20 TaxID=1850526 RepID=UPI0007F09A2F|nr:hypothetical protein [Arachidicoccus sp. BS20]ANI89230.1 hypothetical protein A9P82_07955 [Arachidicoccus sp. BS20]